LIEEGAAGIVAVKVTNLAVEVVAGLTNAELFVIERPVPFLALTPILITLEEPSVEFSLVTFKKFISITLEVLEVTPFVVVALLFKILTPVGNSQTYEIASTETVAVTLRTVLVPIYLANDLTEVAVPEEERGNRSSVTLIAEGAFGKAFFKVKTFAVLKHPAAFIDCTEMLPNVAAPATTLLKFTVTVFVP
jgi:hypothetical protein